MEGVDELHGLLGRNKITSTWTPSNVNFFPGNSSLQFHKAVQLFSYQLTCSSLCWPVRLFISMQRHSFVACKVANVHVHLALFFLLKRRLNPRPLHLSDAHSHHIVSCSTCQHKTVSLLKKNIKLWARNSSTPADIGLFVGPRLGWQHTL